MRSPEFWWQDKPNPLAKILGPVSWAYGRAVRHRFEAANPVLAGVPVVCIGNLVVGGAGKTPVAMDLGKRLLDRGVAVHFLSRGYRGRLPGPVRVDPAHHSYRDVGDEPMMLAKLAPTWISRDRVAGCRAAVADGAGLIVMDDGFQNPSVSKDFSVVVVDAIRGFGNGRVIPGGPLRESVSVGLQRADVVVLLGGGGREIVDQVKSVTGAEFPILRAHIKPDAEARSLAGESVVAFAGIGDPSKFFVTLETLGCRIVGTHSFDDHHEYRPNELERLLAAAKRKSALVVTTAKDAERLPADIRESVRVLTIHVEWENEAAVNGIIDRFL
jgi:tetraacyldisaccharide 4'-kinase